MYTCSTVQCTVYSVHCGCRHISSRPASVQSVADVEGGEEEVRGWRRRRWRAPGRGLDGTSKSSPLVKGPGTTSPATAIGLQRLALKAHRAQPADGTMNEKQVQPDLHPVFAITIDRSIIASDTSVKVSALQPWLRRTVI